MGLNLEPSIQKTVLRYAIPIIAGFAASTADRFGFHNAALVNVVVALGITGLYGIGASYLEHHFAWARFLLGGTGKPHYPKKKRKKHMNKTLKVGQLLAVHNDMTWSEMIRLGEWVHFRAGAEINHWAVVDRFEDGECYVIQAEPHGVTNHRTLESAVGKGGWYKQVELPATCDIDKGLKWLRSQIGQEYGFLDILTDALNVWSPGWISIHFGNSWICSALTAEYARVCGWLHNWENIYDVMPAELWEAMSSVYLTTLQGEGAKSVDTEAHDEQHH